MAGSKRTRSTAATAEASQPSKRARQPPRPRPYDNALQALEQSQSSKVKPRRKGKERALSPVQEEVLEDEESRLHDEALNASMGAGVVGGTADNEEQQEVEEQEVDDAEQAEEEVFSFAASFKVSFGKTVLYVSGWPKVMSNSDPDIFTKWRDWLVAYTRTRDENSRRHKDVYRMHNTRLVAGFERSGNQSLVNDLTIESGAEETTKLEFERALFQLGVWASQGKRGLILELLTTVVERNPVVAAAKTPGSQRRAARQSATEEQVAAIRMGTYGTQPRAESDSPRVDRRVDDVVDNENEEDEAPANNFLHKLHKQWRCSNRYCKNYTHTCWFSSPDNAKDHCKVYAELSRRWAKGVREYEQRPHTAPAITLTDPGSALAAKLWKNRGKEKLNPHAATTTRAAQGGTVIKQYFGNRPSSSSSARRSKSPPVLFSSQPNEVEPNEVVRSCFDWLLQQSLFWQNREGDLSTIYDTLVNLKDFDLQQIYNIKETV